MEKADHKDSPEIAVRQQEPLSLLHQQQTSIHDAMLRPVTALILWY